MDEHSKDFFSFFQNSFLNALLWIALWGIVYLGIELIASENLLVEFVIYLLLLVSVVLIKIFYPNSVHQ
jgi:hypothetical protein